jgi:serine/threonine-protein kinase
MSDEYFMAQEYILGRDLDVVGRRMKERERKRLDASLVFYVAQETLKGLGYAHSRTGPQGEPLGIVHRDVSPMNVMISARGEVKLFDFGIVKAEGRKSQTQHGVVKGNVLFMSPEQARGAYQIDGRADLFSLGLTIFWCLTGETLYRGDTTYDLLMRAAKGPGAEEWDRVGQLPGPAAQLLQRALQSAPGDRFQTADEFAAALPPVGMSGAAASLRNLMQRLFGEEFQSEERRVEASATQAKPQSQRTEGEASAPGDRRASPTR